MKPTQIAIIVLISLVLLWCVTIPIQVIGSHETPIKSGHSFIVIQPNNTAPKFTASTPAPTTTFTNEKAMLWWKVYDASKYNSGSVRAAEAANAAVKACYQ